MPEIGLGIGYERENYAGVTREWLYWYDEMGRRYPTPNERIEQESLRAQQESLRAQQESLRAVRSEQRVEELTRLLRELGVDPDSL
jgi:hypothetical protein